jgi:hypothetical protein
MPQGEAPWTLKSGVKLVVTPVFCQKNVTGKKRNYLCFHISDFPWGNNDITPELNQHFCQEKQEKRMRHYLVSIVFTQ